MKQVFYFGIAALALVALAEPFPGLSVLLAWILIAGVLLNNWKDYVTYLKPGS